MIFSSSTFLLVFLPLVFFVYFVIPNRVYRNIVLLVFSLVFYAWGEPVYVVLMIISILANWAFGYLIEKYQKQKLFLLSLDLVFNLAILGFFKYEAFLASNINALIGATLIPELELALPIGISFYTLQAVSYIADVYKGEVPAQKNPLYLGMYIAMFPQLVAGPIVRYSTIQDQILNRKENLSDFCSGLRLFCIGLGKKVLLANVAAILAVEMLGQGGSNIGLIGAWAGLIAYTFQILFDFSGYSDMAIGLGKMFGFKYLRNFNYPYISKSITEFWRRWHISLGSFFRDYIYIPLGGNRVKPSRWVLNLAIVWFLTGFWHGAAWNYILWGLYYGTILIAEKLWLGRCLSNLPLAVQHLYTIVIFIFGWLLFWIEDMSVMGEYFLALFGAFGLTGTNTFWELTAWSYLPVFALCVMASTPLVPWLRMKLVGWASGKSKTGVVENDLANARMLSIETQCNAEYHLAQIPEESSKKKFVFLAFILADLACLMLLVVSYLSVVSGSFNPFIYFRF